ncbi:hypothetical protein VB816_21770 [Limnoraphis robusta CCNP1324]|uniref:hypothetical protein n=1 Tax=Limnoraphis robusta TaxID=1118279 RepID=UPI002B1F4907|nr:hypothetical protein [Limnoraphis robusta]MEA5547612.1 hypothetical protein [Limnoraphis robusta CCNP1324]
MNTTQYQRPAAERLHAATMGGHNLQGKPAGWTPPNAHGIPHPDRPLAHLDAIQHQALFNALLEDWDNPVFTELGLCRAHDISLDQLIAMAELPTFQRALDMIRRVRAMRRPAIEAAAANTILERLTYLTQCPLDSASAMKECRLAIKQIVAILNPERESTSRATTSRARKEAAEPATQTNASEQTSHSPTTPTQRAPNASEGMVPQDATTTPNPTPPAPPTSERGGAGDPSPASATNQPAHPPAHTEITTPHPDRSPAPDAPLPLDHHAHPPTPTK